MRWYLFHSVLNFIFLLKSKKREKKVRLYAKIYETEIWTASYLKKFDFVGFFTKKQKTIKYERPHLHPYYSKDLIIFKRSIVKRVLNCVYSLWSCAHNPINSHICKSQKKWLLYLVSQNISVTPLYSIKHHTSRSTSEISSLVPAHAVSPAGIRNYFSLKYGVEK